MSTTNSETGTNVVEVADGLFRINTPLKEMPGGFSFNQYLVLDDEPLLFHTGPRRLSPLVQQAIAHVMPVERLRWISYSHVEADECGGLNALLSVAPHAQPVVGRISAMISTEDLSDRPPRVLADGEVLSTGRGEFMWLDMPHLPHGWDCGYLFEKGSRTLLCGDLFTQPGAVTPAVTESDILGPSEAFRAAADYFAHGPHQQALLRRLASLEPMLLACMHGSAWRGDGASILGELAKTLGR